jgi:hypothetical protein
MLLTLAVQKRAAGFNSRDMMTCSLKSRETFDVPSPSLRGSIAAATQRLRAL